jgi:serine/threonine protein kinase
VSTGPPFADRYHRRAILGTGGFGVVWRAWDDNQNQEVALKLFASSSPVIHAYHEARVLTALESDNVLRVFNADTFADIPYIATRIAAEGSAEDKLGLAAPLGARPDDAVAWTRQVLVGLGSCHAFGLVHRDIKPSNIFLESNDWALLGDFGLAHPPDAKGRVPPAGTTVTMAPEMFRQGFGTIVSDVYSIGVSMYRVLSGAWPFEGPDDPEIIRAVLNREYVRLRDTAPHVPKRLADRVEKAMANDPGDRYQTWAEMHAELANHGLSRIWQRIVPHPTHNRCWIECRTRSRGAIHQVCVTQDASGQFDIEARRIGGSRVSRYCRSARDERRLAIALRDTFDHL